MENVLATCGEVIPFPAGGTFPSDQVGEKKPAMVKEIRVLLVASQVGVGDGLRFLIESQEDLSMVGEVRKASELPRWLSI